jgi:ribose 5-phosphate isomerase A
VDLTIDGADEIARDSMDLIKGLGGALLREKIVAAASERLVIVADEPKLVSRLGGGTVPVPIEIVAFGWETTALRLTKLGTNPVLRMAQDGAAFRTDGGNLIVDCHFGVIANPAKLDEELSRTIGVVETGLFIGIATTALVATSNGIVRLDR